jgi:hypothetical protein
MLLPAKHIKLSESLLGLSAFILEKLNKPKTVDLLWNELNGAIKKEEYPAEHSIENIFLTLDFLFLIGLINLDENGEISK